jgi:hypothetical protein
MADLGDANALPWRAWVDIGRKLYFEPIDVTPVYQERPGGLHLYNGEKVTVPWLVRPGVVRDMTYPIGRDEPGSFLSDCRDTWIEEVEVSAKGELVLSPEAVDDVDVLEAQNNYAQQINEKDFDLSD